MREIIMWKIYLLCERDLTKQTNIAGDQAFEWNQLIAVSVNREQISSVRQE